MWTLDEAVATCRMFELALKANGFHCALGGSVLHRGTSQKDVDIFVYPHQADPEGEVVDWDKAEKVLATLGARITRSCSHQYDLKRVKEASFDGKRIDFFFLQ